MSALGLTSSIRHSPGNRAGLFPANNREAQSSRLPGLELADASVAEVLRDSNMHDIFPLPGRCPREIYQNGEGDNRDQQSPPDDPGKNNIIRVEHLSSPLKSESNASHDSMSAQLGKSLNCWGRRRISFARVASGGVAIPGSGSPGQVILRARELLAMSGDNSEEDKAIDDALYALRMNAA
jgi:hypothetical protein